MIINEKNLFQKALAKKNAYQGADGNSDNFSKEDFYAFLKDEFRLHEINCALQDKLNPHLDKIFGSNQTLEKPDVDLSYRGVFPFLQSCKKYNRANNVSAEITRLLSGGGSGNSFIL